MNDNTIININELKKLKRQELKKKAMEFQRIKQLELIKDYNTLNRNSESALLLRRKNKNYDKNIKLFIITDYVNNTLHQS